MHTPTLEQQAILDAAQSTKDNLLISALAGAAKTSTLVLLSKKLYHTPILCLAFNKSIATEMKERLAPNAQAKTLNGLGHQVWMQSIGKKLTLNDGKVYAILKELVDELPAAQKGEGFALFIETLKAVKEGKNQGYIPSSLRASGQLIDEDELFASLDEAPTPTQEDLIIRASEISAKRALEGEIDFADQILLPTVFKGKFPSFPLIMVDEAQDLSALNHATLRLFKGSRVIAVGDACQAIYAFRGAHNNGMAVLKDTFNMRELVLSVSFRCPRVVVSEARWRAPHMQYPEWAEEGVVRHVAEWGTELLPPDCAILCRNNAPIFRLALNLMKAGRWPTIIGNDIGKNLIKTMRKFGKDDMKQTEVFKAIDDWRNLKLAKSRSPASVEDQAACMELFAEQGPTLRAAIAYAESLMNSSGSIKLMTGHKAKGSEFDHVFILDQHLARKGRDQDSNILYVMQTRAKRTLTYITTELFS